MEDNSSKKHFLIKSYNNLYFLATKQLEYIQKDNFELLIEVLDQKQLIIDSISSMDEKTLQLTETDLNQQEAHKIIADTLALESKSQELLELKKPALITKIRSAKRKELISENYGHITSQVNFLDKKI